MTLTVVLQVDDERVAEELFREQVANNPARALRALGLLLADGAPIVGGGKTF